MATKIRPTNYFAMLDNETQTQTENAESIVITIDTSNFDTLSLLGLFATDIEITLTDNTSSQVVYTKTIETYRYKSNH
ncbi:MAG: hypothetical protein Q9M43_10730 [Sulfurimonas sp.]|nr:hypothetical protein [Sulfurimonas sp.]